MSTLEAISLAGRSRIDSLMHGNEVTFDAVSDLTDSNMRKSPYSWGPGTS